MDAFTLQAGLYEISIMRLPLPRYQLSEAPPEVHSIMPHHANTEAEALAECGILVKKGYGVEVTGPNVHWDHAEVLRRLDSAWSNSPM
jgi:hypothetical protein